MPDFSIITCVSDADVYDQCLLRSVNKMRGDYDIEVTSEIIKESLEYYNKNLK